MLFGPKGTCILRKVTYPLAPSRLLRIFHEGISRQRVRPFFCSRQRAWSKSSLRQRVQHMLCHLPRASYVVFCLKQKLIGLFSASQKSTYFFQQAVWPEVSSRPLGAKGYSAKCLQELLAPNSTALSAQKSTWRQSSQDFF